jgi:hypothetical protein
MIPQNNQPNKPSVAVPRLKRLVTHLSSRRQGFDPRPIHVKLAVDKVVQEQLFSQTIAAFPSVQLHQRPRLTRSSITEAINPEIHSVHTGFFKHCYWDRLSNHFPFYPVFCPPILHTQIIRLSTTLHKFSNRQRR